MRLFRSPDQETKIGYQIVGSSINGLEQMHTGILGFETGEQHCESKCLRGLTFHPKTEEFNCE